MAPDLNSLLPQASSAAPTLPPIRQSLRQVSISTAEVHHANHHPSPHSPSRSSIQPAATMNASLHDASPSPSHYPISTQRRRFSALDSISHRDPHVPSSGEMHYSNGSTTTTNDNNNHNISESQRPLHRRSFAAEDSLDRPYRRHHQYHARQPSLGEIHSTLETETEAQVNRLLHQIQLLREQQQASAHVNASAEHHPIDQSTITTATITSPTTTTAITASPAINPDRSSPRLLAHPRPTLGLRHCSSSSLVGARPLPLAEDLSSSSSSTSCFLPPGSASSGARDNAAFYRAETQTLARENQMLQARIRELERLVRDSSGGGGGGGGEMASFPSSSLLSS